MDYIHLWAVEVLEQEFDLSGVALMGDSHSQSAFRVVQYDGCFHSRVPSMYDLPMVGSLFETAS